MARPDSSTDDSSGSHKGSHPFLVALAVIVFGVSGLATARRTIDDATVVFIHSPRQIIPAGLLQQVEIVKTRIPRGTTIFYLMDHPDVWQLGLWQRALYPDYLVLPVEGLAGLQARKLRDYQVGYVISAGSPPLDPDLSGKMELPGYVNGPPTILGRLRAE